MTRRQIIIEARKNLRNLIRLEAKKIALLMDLDQALEQELTR